DAKLCVFLDLVFGIHWPGYFLYNAEELGYKTRMKTSGAKLRKGKISNSKTLGICVSNSVQSSLHSLL
ncbi:hypothetical protein BEN43_20455, partial [Leptospira interrogans serovar Bataviae]|nr:hypothetical protein [Leptospira interrogans serovar Bataviae]